MWRAWQEGLNRSAIFPQPSTKAKYVRVDDDATVAIVSAEPRAVKQEKSKKRKRKEREQLEEKREEKRQKNEEELAKIANLYEVRNPHECVSCRRRFRTHENLANHACRSSSVASATGNDSSPSNEDTILTHGVALLMLPMVHLILWK